MVIIVDNEMDFYYLQLRFYDSFTSIFINIDDLRYISDNGVNIEYKLYIYMKEIILCYMSII